MFYGQSSGAIHAQMMLVMPELFAGLVPGEQSLFRARPRRTERPPLLQLFTNHLQAFLLYFL